jgi:uridine kinase
MIQITVLGHKKVYNDGITLKELAAEYQPQLPYDILLARVNGQLRELHNEAQDMDEISFLTAQDKPGFRAYQRSAVLLLLKAFYDTVDAEKIETVRVDFSLGDGLYIAPKGDFTVDENLARTVGDRMRELAEAGLPIEKGSLHLDEAIARFHRHGMYDKERLFHYRRVSRVNVYRIDGFEDYYYGYMVPDAGYIRWFELVPYQDGLLLMLPTQKNPRQVGEIPKREKLFRTLQESTRWGETLRVSTVGALNDRIAAGGMNELILMQEALMEKKLGDIAELIASRPDKKVVMIAGPSSSGKTTFSHRLSVQLRAKGLIPHPIEVDNYFKERIYTPKDENGEYDFECLGAMDVELFNRDMTDLLAGKEVELPTYNFVTGKREYNGNKLQLGSGEILVIEGIHCLNEQLSYSLPKENKFKIYISALTQLNIDEHNRIPTTDGRLIRRLVRDAKKRGSSAQNTIKMWPSVRRGEEANIFPYQEDADVIFNSALVYELAVLKQYAEPLLFGVPRDSEEYIEAKRLLKFLDYFLGVSSEDIPKNSILREFIGGSCFKV